MKIQGRQFPLRDASPLIAPLHPDRSFGKYGERTLSRARTQSRFLCYTSKRGPGKGLAAASCPNELGWVIMEVIIELF